MTGQTGMCVDLDERNRVYRVTTYEPGPVN